MPCLWVGKPVCHACAVGNHDFQGVPVIMVSLFYPYPYAESVCVLRSLIPEVLHRCGTWLLLLQSARIHCCGWWYATYTTVHRNSVYRKTDQLDILGVYIILGVQERAFKEAFKFIFASICTKQIWFRRKHQESLLIIVEYPVNQLLIYLYGLPSKEIHIRCFKSQLRCQNTRSRSLCSHR